MWLLSHLRAFDPFTCIEICLASNIAVNVAFFHLFHVLFLNLDFFFLLLVPFICHTQIKTLRSIYIQVWHVSYLFVLLWVRISPAFILYHIFLCCFWFEISYCSICIYIYTYNFFVFFAFILRTTSYLLLADLLFSTVSDGDPPCLRCRQHRFVPFTSLEFFIFFKFCFSRLFR